MVQVHVGFYGYQMQPAEPYYIFLLLLFSHMQHFCVLLNQTLCSLLDCLLIEDNTPADSPRELYEIYFVFACVWAFGGALFQDHVCSD